MGETEVWFECACDILSCDHISALCEAAAAQPPTMLAKLTRIYGMTFVHLWKITPAFPFETVKFGTQLLMFYHTFYSWIHKFSLE